MKILRVEVIEENSVIKAAQMPYYENDRGFFVALVTICSELNIDVPIWTSMEDRKLTKKGCVIIPIGKGLSMRIFNTGVPET